MEPTGNADELTGPEEVMAGCVRQSGEEASDARIDAAWGRAEVKDFPDYPRFNLVPEGRREKVMTCGVCPLGMHKAGESETYCYQLSRSCSNTRECWCDEAAALFAERDELRLRVSDLIDEVGDVRAGFERELGFRKQAEQERDSALAQVGELRRRLEQLSRLGNGDRPGNSIGNTIAQEALRVTPSQATARLKALEAVAEAAERVRKGFEGMEYSIGPCTCDSVHKCALCSLDAALAALEEGGAPDA